MRLWAGAGGLMTDEQLLAYLAHFGSPSSAAARGDVRLVAGGGERPAPAAASGPSRGRCLSSYLSEIEGACPHE